jgi:hypothetical protein
MKNWSQYLKLWQKKRYEMRVDDDTDKDWQYMRSLLDENMPEEGGTAKKRGISLLSVMLIALSAAATLYVGTKVIEKHLEKQQHKHHLAHHKHKDSATGIDTTADADSAITLEDSVINKAKLSDSAGDIKIATIPSAEHGKPNTATADKAAPGAAQKETATNTPGSENKNNAAANKRTGRLAINQPSNKATAGGSNHAANHNANPINPGQNNGTTSRNSSSAGIGTWNLAGQSISQSNQIVLLGQPRQSFNVGTWTISSSPIFQPVTLQNAFIASAKGSQNTNKGANTKIKTPGNPNSSFEWGLLIGANSSGSFTPKSQNSNFYGSLPVDAFAGLYGTYDLSEKWGIGTQVRVLSPAMVKGRYAKSTYTQRTDTINVVKTTYTNDSRKIYSVQLPLYAAYHATSNISFKAGPVISFPVKQFSTAIIDSANRALLTGSRYDQKIDLGLSGGVSVRYKRLIFEATYLKGLTNHTITSDSLSYKTHTSGTLQFTIGIQLGGKKK